MKQDQDKLINLIHELNCGREGLPYEITKLFSDNEQPELEESIYLSFEHIERVLFFSGILKYEFEDDEEYWLYLKTKLDDASYYACLAIPLIRQLLENKTGENIKSNHCKNYEPSYSKQPFEDLFSLPDLQRKLSRDAWNLANQMAELKMDYESISTSDELVSWSRCFLKFSADLILLNLQAYDSESHRDA